MTTRYPPCAKCGGMYLNKDYRLVVCVNCGWEYGSSPRIGAQRVPPGSRATDRPERR